MSDVTKIEWADHTWNPWEGCTKVSPGCAHCYAEARNHRFGMDNWGPGKPRRRTSGANWRKPIKWNSEGNVCDLCGTPVMERPDATDCHCGQMGAVGEGHRARVFPSLCDWLDEEVPIEWLADFLKLIHDTPNLDWLLLTKRPANFQSLLIGAHKIIPPILGRLSFSSMLVNWAGGDPPPNVWLGVSVEDQQRADERIPELLKIPARVRFLSVEPLLAPVNVENFVLPNVQDIQAIYRGDDPEYDPDRRWVIVGGESGPKARPCNMEWVRSIVGQCKTAGVPCFVKQFGSNPRWNPDPNIVSTYEDRVCAFEMKHPKGGDPSEWPEDLRVREFPKTIRPMGPVGPMDPTRKEAA